MMTDEERPGPTGLYPDGELRPSDQGELNMGITQEDGKVIVAFGTAVQWIGMDPDHARAMASALLKYADEAECVVAHTQGH